MLIPLHTHSAFWGYGAVLSCTASVVLCAANTMYCTLTHREETTPSEVCSRTFDLLLNWRPSIQELLTGSGIGDLQWPIVHERREI